MEQGHVAALRLIRNIEECMSTENANDIVETSTSPILENGGGFSASTLRTYLIIAGVVIVAVAGIFWWNNQQSIRETEATVALSRIRPLFEAGEFQKALTADSVPDVGPNKVLGLQTIADEYGGTDAGKTASLMAGNCLLSLGKASEARPYFDKAKGSDAIAIEIGALKGLAACYEFDGNYTEAADLYEKAGDRGLKTGLEDRCYLYAGLAYEKAGNKEKAGQLFTKVAEKFEGTESAAGAKSGLARLGMAID